MPITDDEARREYNRVWRAQHRDEVNRKARDRCRGRYQSDSAFREKKRALASKRQKQLYWADPEAGRAESRENAKRRRKKYPDRVRTEQQRYRALHRDQERCRRLAQSYRQLVKKYGPLDEFDHNQCNVCHVVFGSNGRPTWRGLDHDHATGRARGFLCHRCNTALGMVRDDVRILLALAKYLRARV